MHDIVKDLEIYLKDNSCNSLSLIVTEDTIIKLMARTELTDDDLADILLKSCKANLVKFIFSIRVRKDEVYNFLIATEAVGGTN